MLQRLTGGVSNLWGIGVFITFPFQFTSLKETDFPDGLHPGSFAVPGSFRVGFTVSYPSRTCGLIVCTFQAINNPKI